ncbi:MAG: hypothetical protein ACLUI3_02175 [Christensenellales bacterium]
MYDLGGTFDVSLLEIGDGVFSAGLAAYPRAATTSTSASSITSQPSSRKTA